VCKSPDEEVDDEEQDTHSFRALDVLAPGLGKLKVAI